MRGGAILLPAVEVSDRYVAETPSLHAWSLVDLQITAEWRYVEHDVSVLLMLVVGARAACGGHARAVVGCDGLRVVASPVPGPTVCSTARIRARSWHRRCAPLRCAICAARRLPWLAGSGPVRSSPVPLYSRLIMRLLAVTAGDDAQGRLTEADEVVGEIDLGGTVALVLLRRHP